MTLPVPKSVVDASLRAAILLYLGRYPGSRRCEIEDDRAVAAILAHAPTPKRARTWLCEALQWLRERGAIEQQHGRFGWFVVERAA